MKALSMYLFALFLLVYSGANAQVKTLVLGEVIEKPMSEGERHTYQLALESGQFVHVTVEQIGVDVVIAVLGPNGEKIDEVDGPTGTQGKENVRIEAKTSGNYQLEIHPFEGSLAKGRYKIQIEEVLSAAEYEKKLEAERAQREVIVQALKEHLQINAIPIHHIVPGNGFADLQPLKKILHDVKIVGLGEATHGTREFFQIKHRLLEFLVTEMSFSAFVLEASYAACQPINDYVLYGKGDRATVLSGQGYVAWDTEEFSKMLDWFRAYNQSIRDGKKIKFYGVDLWNNGLGRKRVLDYLQKHGADRVSATDSLFQVLAKVEAKWPMLINEEDKETLKKVLPRLQDLINHLTANKDKYVDASSFLIEFDQIFQYTQVMKQWIMANTENSGRDTYMAENLKYLIDRERPDAKFVVWQHNGHISVDENENLGYSLRKQYGDQYYAFGFDFNEGFYRSRVLQRGQASGDFKEGVLPPAPVGSFAWFLSRTNIGNMILDLRKSSGSSAIEQWLNTSLVVHSANWGYQNPSEVYGEGNIKKLYDGMIFFEKTTATRPTANALEAAAKREGF